ncbi:MAG: type II secretion system F family protein, partial [Lentisphaerota bacterium]
MNMNDPYFIEDHHFYSGIDYFVKTLAFAARNNIPFYEAIDGFRREEKNDVQGEGGKRPYLIIFAFKGTSFHSHLLLVSADLRRGIPLSESFNKRLRRYLPSYLLLAIEKAEKEKKLKEILPLLAENISFVNGIRKEIKECLTYPVVQFVNLALIATALMVFIVPKFERILSELYGGNTAYYPEITKTIFFVSGFFSLHFDIITNFSLLGLIAVILIFNLPFLKRILEECLIRLPVFGWYYRSMAQIELSGSMAAFISSGEDVIKAAELSISSSRYQFMKARLRKFINSAEKGRNWIDAWEEMNFFDPLYNMIIRNANMRDKLSEGF